MTKDKTSEEKSNSQEQPTEKNMGFTDHLEELRMRLFKMIISVFVFSIIGWIYSDFLLELITKPNPDVKLISLAPTQMFFVHIKLSFFAGTIISIPVIVYQFWQFIAPGLFPNERNYVFPIIFFTLVCFVVGAMFSFNIVAPYGLQFLKNFDSETVAAQWSIENYISFVTTMTMVFGIVFEMPIVALFLGKVGLINHKMMIKYRRHAIFGAFVLGAVLTPPDGFTQIALAIPLWILYEISIVIVRIVGKKKKENEDESDDD